MENDKLTVPYIVYESAMDRAERRDRWLIFVIVFVITLLVASNIAWVVAWNQFDYVTDDYSIEVDSDGGNANYIGQDGDIYNAKDQGETEKNEQDT